MGEQNFLALGFPTERIRLRDFVLPLIYIKINIDLISSYQSLHLTFLNSILVMANMARVLEGKLAIVTGGSRGL